MTSNNNGCFFALIQNNYTKKRACCTRQECSKWIDFISFEESIILSSIDFFKKIDQLDLESSIIVEKCLRKIKKNVFKKEHGSFYMFRK